MVKLQGSLEQQIQARRQILENNQLKRATLQAELSNLDAAVSQLQAQIETEYDGLVAENLSSQEGISEEWFVEEELEMQPTPSSPTYQPIQRKRPVTQQWSSDILRL